MFSFLKMSGAGNDFIIVDARKYPYQVSQNLFPWQISKIANRRNVGCDQFILLKNSNKADLLMEIYNSDGSISSACGNATRCVAGLLMQEKATAKITVETAAGILSAWKDGDLIAVNMGKPKFSWNEIPLACQKNTDDFVIEGIEKFHFSAVNMGNPHVVAFIQEELNDEEFFALGKLIENHRLFPEKTNVEFAKIISPNHIKVRVWERGAGETLACGSGACAVAVAAINKNLVKKEKIKTSFKGGDLFIKYLPSSDVIMSGGYEKIFSGILDDAFFKF